MTDGFALTMSTVRPPAAAGLGPMLTGSVVVCPNATFSVAGVLIRLSVTAMASVPS